MIFQDNFEILLKLMSYIYIIYLNNTNKKQK